jgi:putative MATE family efflux protein
MWVGRELGDVSLAALSNGNLLWILLLVAAFGVSMAGTVRIARSLGEGDIQGAKAAVGAMMSASAAISLLCVLPMIFCARSLLECLGTPAAALPQAVEYLRILLLSVLPIYLNVAVVATLQAAGDSKTGFYFGVMSVVVDAALNPVLIIGISPFPALGIAGSAFATLASQAILLAALLVRVYKTDHPLRLLGGELSLLRIDWTRALGLLRDAGPMAIQVLWASIEQMLMISLVNRFGADVTAAYGVVVQLWNLIIMPAAALGVAITAIVAQNIGAKRWERVRRVTKLGLAYGVLATALLVSLTEMLDMHICRVFLPTESPSLIFAEEINREATWSLIPLGGYIVWVGVLRATGAVWAPLVISAGVLAARFPITLALLGRWHMQAIWWSFPASAAATCMLAASHVLGRGARQTVSPSG